MNSLSVDEAVAALQRIRRPLPTIRRPLAESVGQVLRETVRSDRPQPPYDRVTMDGFALRAPRKVRREFRVEGTQRAGEAPHRLTSGSGCIEIMTGAVLPRGCDTVVPVENVERRGDTIVVTGTLEPGRFIHRAGSDFKRGATVLQPGLHLDGPALGVAATVGRTYLRVARSPRIALATTGDEVVPVAMRPLPHQIRGSHANALAASLELHGYHGVQTVHLPDNERALARGLKQLLARCDVLIVTGGVSKGRFDFIPSVLAELGVRAVVHGVRQQPGKPFLCGRSAHGPLVFGLPGNPVSALVCLHRYVLPALAAVAGAAQATPLRVRLQEEPGGPDGLTLFRPVRIAQDGRGQLVATHVPMKNSGDFFPLVQSDGFVEIPPKRTKNPLVAFRPWRPA